MGLLESGLFQKHINMLIESYSMVFILNTVYHQIMLFTPHIIFSNLFSVIRKTGSKHGGQSHTKISGPQLSIGITGTIWGFFPFGLNENKEDWGIVVMMTKII